jgi:ribosomal protein L16 Arg81 hydroxylase
MKAVRHLIQTGMVILSLCASRDVRAQTNAPSPGAATPVSASGITDVPLGIQSLILTFDRTRNQFLAQQDRLRIQLNHATTPSERQTIREELQANRQAFLAIQRTIRDQLKQELAALKEKISHEEFLRILNAAQNAATEGGIGHHKGH